jgi:hypothetical protein
MPDDEPIDPERMAEEIDKDAKMYDPDDCAFGETIHVKGVWISGETPHHSPFAVVNGVRVGLN